eukprot:gene5387-6060_t
MEFDGLEEGNLTTSKILSSSKDLYPASFSCQLRTKRQFPNWPSQRGLWVEDKDIRLKIELNGLNKPYFGNRLFNSKDCDVVNRKDKRPVYPHDSARKGHDPWNVNDHPVTYNHEKIYLEEKRRSDLSTHGIALTSIIEKKADGDNNKDNSIDNIPDNIMYSPHRLAVIVPYRDRFEELRKFVPHMDKYLSDKGINFKIYIMNQADNHRFNRASLINVGFLLARNESYDYIAMHDVDLLPLNKDLNYDYPEIGPFHVAAPHLHPKYHYKTFVGGILILSAEQFEEVNGLSNKFWGWGREDDELYMRISEAGYKVQRHGMDITTGYNTFQHEHDSEKRPRDYKRLPGQKKVQFSRDYETGMNNVRYSILTKQELTIDKHPCLVVDVSLHCDTKVTPWCNFPPRKRS